MDNQPISSPFPPVSPQEPIPREIREKMPQQNPYETEHAHERVPQPALSSTFNDIDELEDGDGGALKRLALLVGGIFISLVAVTGLVLYVVKKDAKEEEGAVVAQQQDGLISAALGGVVTNGPAQVIVPPGALMEDTLVQIEKTGPGDFVDEYILMPEGIAFNEPVTVVIPFNREPKNDWLSITYDGEAGTTERLPFMVDLARGVLVMQVKAF